MLVHGFWMFIGLVCRCVATKCGGCYVVIATVSVTEPETEIMDFQAFNGNATVRRNTMKIITRPFSSYFNILIKVLAGGLIKICLYYLTYYCNLL